jgi:alkylation response protein AidB-like acyl-CoA dehydrogenase
MNFDFTSEQLIWRASCEKFAHGLRADGQADPDDGEVWQRLADLGAVDLALSGDEYLTEVAILLEEVGRMAAKAPVLEQLTSAVAAASLGTSGGVTLLLTGHGSVAANRVTGTWGPVILRPETSTFVALIDDRAAALRADSPGMRVEVGQAIDGMTTATVCATSAEPSALHDPDAVRDAYRLARVGLAAEMLGGAAEVISRAVAYTMERWVFGRPIARFQAVQHALADAEITRWAAFLAVYEAADTGSLAPHDTPAAKEARALSIAARAYLDATTTASHIIAGIGHIDDHWLPSHYRRAIALDLRTGGRDSRALSCLAEFRTADG